MENKINILHIITNAADGGLENIVYLIISKRKSPHLSHSVAILTPYHNSIIYNKLLKLDLPIRIFNFQNRLTGAESFFNNIAESIRLARHIKSNKIHIIHTHDFFPAFVSRVSVILARLFYFYKPKKVFVTLHSIYVWLKPVHHRINKLLSLFTDKIICVSSSVLEFSFLNDRISKQKYTIIYNGVDVSLFTHNDDLCAQVRSKLKIDNSKIVIGNIGVFSKVKGQIVLLEAFAKAVRLYPNLLLILIGSSRNNEFNVESQLLSMIKVHKLENKVLLLPPTEKIHEMYSAFDVFVMPSVIEGFGLCAIEAMLSENICLFSDILSFRDMIRENFDGILFKSEDSDDLCDKLVYIIENIKSLNYLGKNARKEAISKYDVNRMVNEYETLYLDGILNEK